MISAHQRPKKVTIETIRNTKKIQKKALLSGRSGIDKNGSVVHTTTYYCWYLLHKVPLDATAFNVAAANQPACLPTGPPLVTAARREVPCRRDGGAFSNAFHLPSAGDVTFVVIK